MLVVFWGDFCVGFLQIQVLPRLAERAMLHHVNFELAGMGFAGFVTDVID